MLALAEVVLQTSLQCRRTPSCGMSSLAVCVAVLLLARHWLCACAEWESPCAIKKHVRKPYARRFAGFIAKANIPLEVGAHVLIPHAKIVQYHLRITVFRQAGCYNEQAQKCL